MNVVLLLVIIYLLVVILALINARVEKKKREFQKWCRYIDANYKFKQ